MMYWIRRFFSFFASRAFWVLVGVIALRNPAADRLESRLVVLRKVDVADQPEARTPVARGLADRDELLGGLNEVRGGRGAAASPVGRADRNWREPGQNGEQAAEREHAR